MDIKGHSFIENVLIAAAFSRIETKSSTANPSSSLKNLETKMITFLDSIFAQLSAAYREKRVKISHRIMMMHADSAAAVSKVSAKILLNKEVETQTDALKEQKLAKIEAQLEKTVEEFPDFLKEMDVNALFASKPEIEEQAQAYKERKNLEALATYLQENPGALAAFSFLYQEIASAKFVEDFTEVFGDLDVEGLYEIPPHIEEIAAQYHLEKDMAEFKQTLIENPGALAAFIYIIQAYAVKGQEG